MHRRGRKGKSKSESAGKREDNDKEEEGYDGETEKRRSGDREGGRWGGCIIKQGDNKVVRISGLGRGVVKGAWRITEGRGLIREFTRVLDSTCVTGERAESDDRRKQVICMTYRKDRRGVEERRKKRRRAQEQE